mgnify:CR=1 FL=1
MTRGISWVGAAALVGAAAAEGELTGLSVLLALLTMAVEAGLVIFEVRSNRASALEVAATEAVGRIEAAKLAYEEVEE